MAFDALAVIEDECDPTEDIEVNLTKSETKEETTTKEDERELIYLTLLEVHRKEIDLYVKAKSKLKEGKDFAIRCVWAQCSTGMKAVLQNRKGFIIAILEHVRTAFYDFNVAGNPYNIYWHALYRLVNTRQKKNEDGHSFRERMLTSIKRFEQVGGCMSRLMNVEKTDTEISDNKHAKIVMQRLAAMMQFQ